MRDGGNDSIEQSDPADVGGKDAADQRWVCLPDPEVLADPRGVCLLDPRHIGGSEQHDETGEKPGNFCGIVGVTNGLFMVGVEQLVELVKDIKGFMAFSCGAERTSRAE